MSVAIILPARLKSTRLPDKLLLEAAGKTILEHTLERAREAQAASKGLITRILVAADDQKLIAVAKRAGADAVMTDPNHASGSDRVAEAARTISEEIIVNLQADEPEIDPQSVLLAAKLLVESGGSAPMSTLAVPIFDEAEWKKSNIVKVIVSGSGDALYFSRAPIPFIREPNEAPPWTIGGKRVFGLHHLGLYAYRKDFLLGYKALPESKLEKLEKLEQLRAIEAGHKIKVGVVGSNPPGIDTPEDYAAFVKRKTQDSALRTQD
jgi:3-deoxy-manno-octulosonate cytidylyltransferase (CMP-KDO synthetase)